MGLRELVYTAYEKRLARTLAQRGAAVPRHVGVILDGNRRWAKSVGASSREGHQAGADKIVDLLRWCDDAGVEVVTLWLLSTGHTGWGIFLGVYGLFAISGSDNVIRPYFISRGAQLPFLLTILGVLGGAIAFGLLGIFLGPVLLGVGYTLVAEFAGLDTTRTFRSER